MEDGIKGGLECEVCKVMFENRADFEKHLSSHDSWKPYRCSVCGRSFSNETRCKEHESLHVVGKPFECDVCSIKFTRKGSLIRHMRLHTGENLTSCPHCNKQFADATYLEGHLRKHTGEKPYKCSLCDKRFSQRYGLKIHQTVHQGIEMTCSVCGKLFRNRGSFKRHIRNHKVDKNWDCTICGKTLKSDYESHMQIHSGVKNFNCTICNKSFRRKTTLRDHLVRHEKNDNVIKCTKCGEQVLQKTDLQWHLCRVRKNECFQCAECGKEFTTKRILKEHLVSHSDDPYRCLECKKIFSSMSQLKRHQQKRKCKFKYKCFICNQGYKIKDKAVFHLKASHAKEEETGVVSASLEKSFQCSTCEKFFSSKHSCMWHEACFHNNGDILEQKDVDEDIAGILYEDMINGNDIDSANRISSGGEEGMSKNLVMENVIFIKEEVMDNMSEVRGADGKVVPQNEEIVENYLETNAIEAVNEESQSSGIEHFDIIVKEERCDNVKEEM